MGCRLSKSYLTIIESSPYSEMNDQTIELVKDAHDLIYFLKGKNHSDYKCIFIFGGYGSNKGEFIFDLLGEDLKRGEKIREQFGWRYIYLDVEELIIRNIKTRVRQLTGSFSQEEEEEEEEGKQEEDENVDNDDKDKGKDSDKEPKENGKNFEKQSEELSGAEDSGRWEDSGFLRKYFGELSNVITNNWVRQLIEKEIQSCDESDSDSKFIINLVPNRINLFRDSLYLKQGPNFSHFDCEFIAVNLIRNDHTKKDLDLIMDFHSYEDISDYFVEYFRSINKLIEVKIGSKKMEPRMIITRKETAIMVKNCLQLEELLKTQGNQFLEVNIQEFENTFNSKGPLVFLIDNQIDTGQEIIAIDPSETDVKAIRNFVHCYIRIKKDLDP